MYFLVRSYTAKLVDLTPPLRITRCIHFSTERVNKLPTFMHHAMEVFKQYAVNRHAFYNSATWKCDKLHTPVPLCIGEEATVFTRHIRWSMNSKLT